MEDGSTEGRLRTFCFWHLEAYGVKWGFVASILPQTLAEIGIPVSRVAAYLVLTAVPSWFTALIAVGGASPKHF
jgi:hypothetical protein